MQGSPFKGKGGLVNIAWYLPGKGRHGKCRVVPSRKTEYFPGKGSVPQDFGVAGSYHINHIPLLT